MLNHALSSRKEEDTKTHYGEARIDNTFYKRVIVKSPCFTVKATEKLPKRLFACGTQHGQIFIADADKEPTTNHERLYFYRSRYYDSTVHLENEKQTPRILLPESKRIDR